MKKRKRRNPAKRLPKVQRRRQGPKLTQKDKELILNGFLLGVGCAAFGDLLIEVKGHTLRAEETAPGKPVLVKT